MSTQFVAQFQFRIPTSTLLIQLTRNHHSFRAASGAL